MLTACMPTDRDLPSGNKDIEPRMELRAHSTTERGPTVTIARHIVQICALTGAEIPWPQAAHSG